VFPTKFVESIEQPHFSNPALFSNPPRASRVAQDLSRFFRIWGGSPGGQMNPLHLEEQLLHLPLEAMLMFLEV
jgi:hypothetical protein